MTRDDAIGDAVKNEKFLIRFWSKVDKSGECHLWTGHRCPFGYGNIGHRTKTFRAHRVAWAIANGAAFNGLCVLHRCDVPACVRIDHLFLGTQIENSEDMTRKGRRAGRVRGRNGRLNGRAVLADGDVLDIRERVARGGESKRGLAREYGVAEVTIRGIVSRRLWRCL